MRILVLGLATALLLSACEAYSTQTSSGADYLARYDAAVAAQPVAVTTAASKDRDTMIRRAAAVEPILTFPARFGLARIEHGRLTGIPADEIALWAGLAERHRSLGEFVAISPIVAYAAFSAAGLEYEQRNWRDPGELVTKIRLGAARQHVDAVLIYEVGSTADRDFTPLAIVDLTIIGGAFLPTRSVKAHGVASALLMDVRNGYPYGTASANADLSTLSVTYGSDRQTRKLRAEAAVKVVENLVPEVDTMIQHLVIAMAARKLPES